MKKKLYGAWATVRQGDTSREKIFRFFADPWLEFTHCGIDGAALARAKKRFKAEDVTINSSWRSHSA